MSRWVKNECRLFGLTWNPIWHQALSFKQQQLNSVVISRDDFAVADSKSWKGADIFTQKLFPWFIQPFPTNYGKFVLSSFDYRFLCILDFHRIFDCGEALTVLKISFVKQVEVIHSNFLKILYLFCSKYTFLINKGR